MSQKRDSEGVNLKERKSLASSKSFGGRQSEKGGERVGGLRESEMRMFMYKTFGEIIKICLSTFWLKK